MAIEQQTRIERQIADDIDIILPAFTVSKHVSRTWEFDLNISPGADVTSAYVDVTAQNPDVLSGAKLTIEVNDNDIKEIEWHAADTLSLIHI